MPFFVVFFMPWGVSVDSFKVEMSNPVVGFSGLVLTELAVLHKTVGCHGKLLPTDWQLNVWKKLLPSRCKLLRQWTVTSSSIEVCRDFFMESLVHTNTRGQERTELGDALLSWCPIFQGSISRTTNYKKSSPTPSRSLRPPIRTPCTIMRPCGSQIEPSFFKPCKKRWLPTNNGATG